MKVGSMTKNLKHSCAENVPSTVQLDTRPRMRTLKVPQLSGVDVEEEIIEDVDINDLLGSNLVVHNDNHNSFPWVIQCFMEVLHHSSQQAEQCAWIIHYKGKAQVKSGSYEDMCVLKDGLTDRGLSATVE